MSTAPQQPGRRRSPTSLMLALEPRLMFDAAAIASVDDTLAAAAHAGDATAHAGDAPAVAPTDPAAAGTANRAAAAAGTATVTPAAPAVDQQIERAYEAFQKGDLAASRSLYQASLQRDPVNRDALLGLAAIDMRTGQPRWSLPASIRATNR